MKHELSIKSVKQSAANVSKFLQEEGHSIPKSTVYEIMSKVFFFKNWNTLKAKIEDPADGDFKKESKRIVILESNCPREFLVQIMKNTMIRAKCEAPIESISEKNGVFRIVIDTIKNYPNTLTMLILVTNNLMESPYEITKFHFWDVKQIKEDILPYVNSRRSGKIFNRNVSLAVAKNSTDKPSHHLLKETTRRNPDRVVNGRISTR